MSPNARSLPIYRAAIFLAALLIGVGLSGPALGQSSQNPAGDAGSAPAQHASGSGQDSGGTGIISKPTDDDRLPFMNSDNSTDASQPSALGLLARTLGALLLVIGLLIGSVWGLKRIRRPALGGKAESPELAVLTTVGIGDRRSLVVVRFGESMLLLGSTPQSVTLLATDDVEVKPVRQGASAPTEAADGQQVPASYRGSLFADQLELASNWDAQREEYVKKEGLEKEWE